MERTLAEILASEIRMRRERPVLYRVAQLVLFVEQPGLWLRAWWWRRR